MMATKVAARITPEDVARNGHVVVFLRREMEARQWGVADLVKALGLPHGSTTIYPWLKGTGTPGPAMRLKLGEVFKVPAATFEPRDPGEHLPVHAPGTFGAVGKMMEQIQRPLTSPNAAHAVKVGAPRDVLSFNVGANGIARIRLDIELPLVNATPLLRMLLDAGLVFSQDGAPTP
jgi:transcriptional regulator with XRE-family HTH domain